MFSDVSTDRARRLRAAGAAGEAACRGFIFLGGGGPGAAGTGTGGAGHMGETAGGGAGHSREAGGRAGHSREAGRRAGWLLAAGGGLYGLETFTKYVKYVLDNFQNVFYLILNPLYVRVCEVDVLDDYSAEFRVDIFVQPGQCLPLVSLYGFDGLKDSVVALPPLLPGEAQAGKVPQGRVQTGDAAFLLQQGPDVLNAASCESPQDSWASRDKGEAE